MVRKCYIIFKHEENNIIQEDFILLWEQRALSTCWWAALKNHTELSHCMKKGWPLVSLSSCSLVQSVRLGLEFESPVNLQELQKNYQSPGLQCGSYTPMTVRCVVRTFTPRVMLQGQTFRWWKVSKLNKSSRSASSSKFPRDTWKSMKQGR